jgi:hypothetical protein
MQKNKAAIKILLTLVPAVRDLIERAEQALSNRDASDNELRRMRFTMLGDERAKALDLGRIEIETARLHYEEEKLRLETARLHYEELRLEMDKARLTRERVEREDR